MPLIYNKKAVSLEQNPTAFQKYEDQFESFEFTLASRKKTRCLSRHENHSDLTFAKEFRDLQYQKISEISVAFFRPEYLGSTLEVVQLFGSTKIC